eukprot:TRINITY_DN532_c0_g1_i1.p1 TRINITY_DN532_c0_g1~~TRINITY_DN532_c0_g1_i1.p1  ORF type:complete len:137 (+),score=11.70 TRINITY_DN532_c0_g1_i1:143-553(+)
MYAKASREPTRTDTAKQGVKKRPRTKYYIIVRTCERPSALQKQALTHCNSKNNDEPKEATECSRESLVRSQTITNVACARRYQHVKANQLSKLCRAITEFLETRNLQIEHPNRTRYKPRKHHKVTLITLPRAACRL